VSVRKRQDEAEPGCGDLALDSRHMTEVDRRMAGDAARAVSADPVKVRGQRTSRANKGVCLQGRHPAWPAPAPAHGGRAVDRRR
jgi:hypothetical protein